MKQLVTFNQQKRLTSSEIPDLSKKSKKIFQKKKKAFVDYWFFLIFQTFNITFTINNTLWFSLNFFFFPFFLTDFMIVTCHCFGISTSSILLNRKQDFWPLPFPLL